MTRALIKAAKEGEFLWAVTLHTWEGRELEVLLPGGEPLPAALKIPDRTARRDRTAADEAIVYREGP